MAKLDKVTKRDVLYSVSKIFGPLGLFLLLIIMEKYFCKSCGHSICHRMSHYLQPIIYSFTSGMESNCIPDF